MESVIMTTPGNNTRLKSRLRSAASALCARSSRKNIRHITPKNNKNLLKNVRNINKNLEDNIRNNCDKSNNNRHEDTIEKVTVQRGIFTREVYNIWCGRLGEVSKVPSDTVQALFNDMHLYPSKSQVLEMLQCARQCSRRNSAQFLTFGEFCVFAGELRNGDKQICNQVRCVSRINDFQCEVFLGGSCNPTTWRADIAIPALTKLGISYYNPQVSTWGPELMAAEHDAKESASVLFFVVDSQTRCIAGMIEVAHLVAKKRCLVIVMYPFTDGQSIMEEPLSTQEFLDLSEGQLTLLMLLRHQGVSVHNNLSSALQSTSQILRGNTTNLESERRLTDKLIKLREMFDKLDTNKTGEISMQDVCIAYYQFTNSMLTINDLYSIMNVSNQTNPEDVRINFEQFCGIIAEFTGSYNNTRIQDWVNQPLQRQTSANNNSNFEYSQTMKYDIYLGGSKTSWRQTIAVPLLKKYGATYYNPSISEKREENLNENAALDMQAFEDSKVLLFVIPKDSRCITFMILAAYFIALKKNVVLCVQQLPQENCLIGTDLLTKQGIKDYNRARAYLCDLAKHDHVPIFESVSEAVQHAINLSQQR